MLCDSLTVSTVSVNASLLLGLLAAERRYLIVLPVSLAPKSVSGNFQNLNPVIHTLTDSDLLRRLFLYLHF